MKSISKKLAAVGVVVGSMLLPLAVMAQSQITVDAQPLRNTFNTLLAAFNNIVVPILVAIVVVWIIISAFRFALAGGNEDARTAARNNIVWGLVGIVIIFAIWGIVRIATTLVSTTATPQIPPTPNFQIP